ncbi:MAG TPA: MFS transporter [Marmoricola sp.]|nr:MFS transporter [Marmoricola sp.]
MAEEAVSVAAPPTGGLLSAARASVRETGASVASVFRNPRLRKMELAFAGSLIGDWASSTATAVFAYGVGGTKAVGLFYTIRLGLMAVASPFMATLADRISRRLVMVVCDLVRLVIFAGAAACLYLQAPVWPVFVLAGAGALVASAFRPAQAAWMPSLADSPDELTAANGTASTLESLAFFLGPALGAFLLTLTDVPTVFVFNAATFAWSALLVLSIRVRADARDGAEDEPSGDGGSAGPGFLSETTAGFRAIAADGNAVMVAVLTCVQTVVAGASAVYTVVMAVEILETGPKGVGYLDSAFGVGAILGGLVAIGRSKRRKLATDLAIGVILWSIPLVAVWLAPSIVVVFAAVVAMGFGNPLVDVNFATILQRIMPDEVLGRVFGALEGALIGTMALGSALMPFLIDGLGFDQALAVLGVGITLLVLPWIPRARRLDGELAIPAGVPLLESIPMFTPLGPTTIESLARKLRHFEVPAGVAIVQEGQESDRFYVIESGSVRVSHGDTVIRHEGAGDFFGEIGLLRDVPRTATVTAEEDTVLQVLERDDFLAAVTGQDDARTAADSIVSRRIAV